MTINTVVVACLVVIGLPGSGIAATMSDLSSAGPFIQGRNAYSRFLQGSYRPDQKQSDDGFPLPGEASPAGSGDRQPGPGPEADPLPAAGAQAPSSAFWPESLAAVSNLSRPVGDNTAQGFGSSVLETAVPSSHLSTVPLPASSSLFGVALLVLGGFGLRRRAARQA